MSSIGDFRSVTGNIFAMPHPFEPDGEKLQYEGDALYWTGPGWYEYGLGESSWWTRLPECCQAAADDFEIREQIRRSRECVLRRIELRPS